VELTVFLLQLALISFQLPLRFMVVIPCFAGEAQTDVSRFNLHEGAIGPRILRGRIGNFHPAAMPAHNISPHATRRGKRHQR